MIKKIFFKIKNYDILYEDFLIQKKEIEDLNIYIKHLEVNLNMLKRDLDEEKENSKALSKKLNNLDLPKKTLKELEKKLLLADNYTLEIIREYLILDSYELVKNIASRVDNSNITAYISYRDWALGRNEELKKLIEKYIKKDNTFVDKIEWETKSIKNIF